MTRTKKIILVLVLVLLITLTACAILIVKNNKPIEESQGMGNAAVGATGASSVITYTDAGFSSTALTLAVGTTATWSNESTRALHVSAEGANKECDTDKLLKELNECASVTQGGSYSFTFTEPGTYTYVNTEYPAHTAIIYVTADSMQAGTINPNAIPE